MSDHRFPKQLRLLRASEFERVFAAKTHVSDPWLALFGVANELGYPRLGLVVSRRIGNAVARARWKRLMREAFRLSQHRLPALDLICIARAPAPPELHDLIETLCRLAQRIERRRQHSARRAAGESP